MKEKEWYDDENLITSMLIGLLILIVLLSQSFAIRHQLGLGFIVRSLLNYNLIYLIFLAYLILIKTKVGKRNFSLANVVLIVIQLLVCLASLFNIFQAHLVDVVNFFLNAFLLVYMIYVLLKGTSLWKALHLDKIPFEKLKNDYYFYGITGISFLLLIIQIFLNLTFDSIALSLLECLFTIGFSRYLYLFKVYQDEKELPEQEAQPLKEELSKEKASKKKSKKEVSE